MSKKDNRGSLQIVASIHKYWLKEVSENMIKYTKLLGENAVDNIRVGDGELCYACGNKPKYGLTRCRIVPHSLGGSGETSNIFLMCDECHEENPDTIYSDMFYKYVRNRESFVSKLFSKSYKILSSFVADATEDEMKNIRLFTQKPAIELVEDCKEITSDKYTIAAGRASFETIAAIIWKRATGA